ncbi:MAG: beta-L-arabinofuranosidase domain-containing protein, partial [Solirubrobacterales bacterium]
MRTPSTVVLAWAIALAGGSIEAQTSTHLLEPVSLEAVRVQDAFWSPKFDVWRSVTVNDALDKFEQAGAFRNFDRVAKGLKEKHEGPPWFDGLVYETIRAASDFLASSPDPVLDKRLDGCIQRIAAAQQRSSDGYILTYTQLDE